MTLTLIGPKNPTFLISDFSLVLNFLECGSVVAALMVARRFRPVRAGLFSALLTLDGRGTVYFPLLKCVHMQCYVLKLDVMFQFRLGELNSKFIF